MRDIDQLALLLGDDYVLNDRITIHQPTIKSIKQYGEKEYFNLVAKLTAYPGDMKYPLWQKGIDYENISDFEMFLYMTRSITAKDSYILFGDLDLSAMKVVPSDVGRPMLYDEKNDIRIDENIYRYIFNFLVTTHRLHKDHEYAGNEETKQLLIELDRQDREMAENAEFKSGLYNIISTLVNIDGFKYDYDTIQDLTLYQLMDSVARVQVIKSSLALLQGSYSGMIDTSKIDKEYFNFLREIKVEN